jgi:Xaa-Pro aminopeptidase
LDRQFKAFCNLFPINTNLIDCLSKERKKIKSKPFYSLKTRFVGESINSKINRLVKKIIKDKIDNIFISAPENVAWLLNLRGSDNPNSPIPNCRIILTKNKKIFFFSNIDKIKKIKKVNLIKNIKYYTENDFYNVLNLLNGSSFLIDDKSCSIYFENLILSKFKIINKSDPCYLFKSIKNKTEIKNMEKAHIEDGVALTKFLYWIKNKKKNGLDELGAEKKLEKFRKERKNFLYPSFNTIAGSGPNGAIIHYRANKKTNRKIKSKDIFLCDSGGQYKYGTTDVTRTICFAKPNNRIKNIFTRVLKGHIAVAMAELNELNTGYKLDKKARYWLNKINLDYGHGTGHGVGYFLNVHEGPQAISKYNNIKLQNGMILSNEPGYYEKNKFGIRIENVVYIKKIKNKLLFKNLTLAPIDIDLINFKLLDNKEKKYLSCYHKYTYQKVSNFLNKEEKIWLKNLI